MSDALLKIAKSHIGLKEVPGEGDNPTIVGMFAKVGHPYVKNDEVAWCAAFVGACLIDAGFASTKMLNARSYLKWGKTIPLAEARPGDIVIFWRNSPTSWEGHVAVFVSQTKTMVKVVGGNQDNAVTIQNYLKERVLGVRRPVAPAALPAKVQKPRPPARPAADSTPPAHPTKPPAHEQPPSVAGGRWAALMDAVKAVFKWLKRRK